MLAGVGVLVLLLVIVGALVPPYFDNMAFQRYLDSAVPRATAQDALVADIVNKAAQMGLPVHATNIRVTHTGNGMHVDIVYVIRVDLPLYTVDLHFHPAAGG